MAILPALQQHLTLLQARHAFPVHHVTPHHTTLHFTPHHTSPHHTSLLPHHTTLHTTPHHTIPHHTTPHFTPHLTTPHLTTPHHNNYANQLTVLGLIAILWWLLVSAGTTTIIFLGPLNPSTLVSCNQQHRTTEAYPAYSCDLHWRCAPSVQSACKCN